MLFIILESLIELWAMVWMLAWNLGLESRTEHSELRNLGHNHTLVALFMWLEALNCMGPLSCMNLGAQVIEKALQLRVWALGVVVWLLGVLQFLRKVSKVSVC